MDKVEETKGNHPTTSEDSLLRELKKDIRLLRRHSAS
jgi:hypothetical protein